MMFKVIVRNFFFVCTKNLLTKYNIIAPLYARELLTLPNCRKNLL